MEEAPIPPDEERRLSILDAMNILETEPEERFDRITRIATKYFNVPISTITLLGKNQEWYKSCQGMPSRSADRAISFCSHTVSHNKPLIIKDTLKDKRFNDNPMVVSSPNIRSYAGIPILSKDGVAIGAFCVKDREPRTFTRADIADLKSFAAWTELELNAQELSRALIRTKFELWSKDRK